MGSTTECNASLMSLFLDQIVKIPMSYTKIRWWDCKSNCQSARSI